MSTEIANTTPTTVALPMPDIAALQASSAFQEKDPELFKSFGTFYPRLQLFTGQTKEVKAKLMPSEEYGLVVGKEKKLVKLGPTVLFVPLAWRAKAVDMRDRTAVKAFHKQKSSEFLALKKLADDNPNSGCMYGPEFLLWLGETHGLVTFLLGTKSARNESSIMGALLPKPGPIFRTGILSSQFLQNKEYQWWSVKAEASSQSLGTPTFEGMEKVIVDFLNPADSVVEETEEVPAATPQVDR